MVNRDHLKQFLLHEEQSVREFVSEYFEDAWDEGPDLMPLVLEACQRYGDEANTLVLARAGHFAVNDESLSGVLKRLGSAIDRNVIYHLNSIVEHAPVELLAAHEAELLESGNLDSDTLERIRRRQDFRARSGEELWHDLQRFSRESKKAKHVGEIDHSYADDLIEALAIHDLPSTQTICELLVSPEVDGEWLEIFLIDLAGARKVREAIPALVEKFRIDTDYMLERASKALARIGDPEAIRLIRAVYHRESWAFRLSTSAVLEKIKCQESEDAIPALLAAEADSDIRTTLCFGLCKQFSERGVETVREEIARGYDEGIVSLEDTLLDVSAVLGISLPEADAWRVQREADRRRLAARQAELAEMGRRYEALKAQGIDPFAKLQAPTTGEPRKTTPPAVLEDPDAGAPFHRATPKIGRNAPCPCGSGKKYKKCCGKGG